MLNLASMVPVKFPEGFIWGSSTAGHQIEGNNVNSQWYADEMAGLHPERSGMACNNYELYKEDAQLVKILGHQAYRMSIEWARVEPEEGRYDEDAVAHYIDYFEHLKSLNIKVFLTLHHGSHPQWFEKHGGFEKRENQKYFEKYLDFIVPRIAVYVDVWNVFNEFNCRSTIKGNIFKANFLAAYAKAYHLIKQYSRAPVSNAHALVLFEPEYKLDRLDCSYADLKDWIMNEFYFHAIRTGEIVLPFRDMEFIPELKGAQDCWCVNYYTRHLVSARKEFGNTRRYDCNHFKAIAEDFYLEEFYPEGFMTGLERLTDQPVYITENGCASDDDKFRIVCIARYLQALNESIRRGVDVLGYLHWSLMDNYEWGSFKPKFGLVDIDFKTFKRTPKPSAYFYKEIIEGNGLDKELVTKYLPELKKLRAYPIL